MEGKNPYAERKRKLALSAPSPEITLEQLYNRQQIILASIESLKSTVENLIKSFHSLQSALVIPTPSRSTNLSKDLEAKYIEMYGLPPNPTDKE